MKSLQKALNKVEGYLMSMERDAVKGQYELKVGIPKNWAYKANDKIDCETLQETKQGDLVRVFAIDDDVVVDDLIEFVNIIIETNKKIADMQKELDEQLEKQAKQMEEYAVQFMSKIEEVKESSFEEMEEKQKSVGEPTKEPTKENLEEEIEEKLSK